MNEKKNSQEGRFRRPCGVKLFLDQDQLTYHLRPRVLYVDIIFYMYRVPRDIVIRRKIRFKFRFQKYLHGSRK